MAKSLNRGRWSLIALVVINPIVIIFYQNCSMMPLMGGRPKYAPTTAVNAKIQPASREFPRIQDRAPASEILTQARDSQLSSGLSTPGSSNPPLVEKIQDDCDHDLKLCRSNLHQE